MLEQTKKKEEKSESKWLKESKIEDIVRDEYPKNGIPKEKMEIDLQQLSQNSIFLLKTWKKLTEKEREIFPIGLKHLLDEASEGILNFE